MQENTEKVFKSQTNDHLQR